METPFVNIHTHRPTGHGIEPASAGIHPWEAAEGDLATLYKEYRDVIKLFTYVVET